MKFLSKKSLAQRDENFLATKKFALATKSKNLGASWPQGFFSKVEPWKEVFFVSKCITWPTGSQLNHCEMITASGRL